MRHAKKVLLLLLVITLLSQIPFAYRRYQLHKLAKAVQNINSERRPIDPNYAFSEYKGVVHVHSFLGGHSTGSFGEIISAAKSNQLQFVVMTEHLEKEFDTAEQTLKGVHAGVLFVNGNELSTNSGDRLLVLPGGTFLSDADKLSTAEVASKAHSQGSIAIAAYPGEFKSWQSENLTGLEVYNVFTNSRGVSPIVAFFDTLWSQRSYPDLLYATVYKRPDDGLRKWDELLSRRRVTATPGNDAHSNIGVTLVDGSGKQILGIKLDPYETSFRLVRLHVLIPRDKPLDPETLLNSIRSGHCFIGFDLFGDTSGFRFELITPTGIAIQGDEVSLRPEGRLKVTSPVSSRIVLLKDGKPLIDETGVSEKEIPIVDRGVYRVEVFLPQLGKMVGDKPWIISNPIYVK